MIYVLVLLSFIAGSSAIGADCKFDNFNKRYPPIFVEEHVEDKRRLLPATDTLYVHHGRKITALCNNLNLKSEDVEVTSTNEQIRFDCNNGTLAFEDSREVEKFLQCHTPGFYRQQIWGCRKFPYIIALLVEGTPVVLSEVCYDDEKMNTEFVHYILANRSPILQRQADYNPVPTGPPIFTRGMIQLTRMSFVHFSNEEIKEKVRSKIESLAEAVSFSEAAIVPDEMYYPYFVYRNKVNTVIWWDSLKNGNWKFIQASLVRETNWTSFDIYAGTSGAVRAHNRRFNGDGDILKFEKMSRIKPIPLYIWNYIKPKDAAISGQGTRHSEVVIIGVNSPYVSGPNAREIRGVCHYDICHTISWLSDIQNTIKLPAFGYIICCEPSKLLGRLHGVPVELIEHYKQRYPDSIPHTPLYTNNNNFSWGPPWKHEYFLNGNEHNNGDYYNGGNHNGGNHNGGNYNGGNYNGGNHNGGNHNGGNYNGGNYNGGNYNGGNYNGGNHNDGNYNDENFNEESHYNSNYYEGSLTNDKPDEYFSPVNAL